MCRNTAVEIKTREKRKKFPLHLDSLQNIPVPAEIHIHN